MVDLRKKVFLLAKAELEMGNVLLELATGVGKTKISLDLAQDYGARNVVVLVPTDKVGEAWVAEIKKWGSHLSVTTINYLSAHNVLSLLMPPDLVIMDEAHHITERNLESISKYQCPLLALSATVDWEKMTLLKRLGFKRGISVSLDEASQHQLVAEYQMSVIYFPVDKTNKTILAGNKEKQWYSTEREALDYAERRISQAKYTRNSKSIEFAYINRTRLIRTLPSRVEIAKKMIERLRIRYPTAKILVFAPDIESCEKIVPDCFYHSKTDDTGFNAFVNGKYLTMGSVNAISEGINVVADIAVIVAGMSKERHTVQRLGRILRKTSVGKMGLAFLLVAKDTQDEVWAVESTSGLANVKAYQSSALGL